MFTPDHMANVVDLDSANMAAMGPARGEPDHVVGVPFGDPDNSPQWGRLVESRITARASAVKVLVVTPQWGRLVESRITWPYYRSGSASERRNSWRAGSPTIPSTALAVCGPQWGRLVESRITPGAPGGRPGDQAAMGPARGEPDHRIALLAAGSVQTPQWGRLVERVRLSEGWAFSGCFGHAVRPRLGMLAGS